MPGGDKTGPEGQGQGRGWAQENRSGAGTGGFCVCSACGEKIPHQSGVPCNSAKCPQCGAQMKRE